MTTTTTNLSLIKWSAGTDKFDHAQLAANLDAIDTIPDNIRKIKLVSALPDGVTEPLFAGRLAMLTAAVGGFSAYTLVEWDGAKWGAVGTEYQPALPVSNLFAGRTVMLTSATGQFPANSLVRYDGSAWQLVGALNILSNGSSIASRPKLNLIAGNAITLTPADNSGQNRVDLTVAVSQSAYARVYSNAVVPIAASGATALTYTTVRGVDTGTFFNISNPTRLTAATVGLHGITGTISWATDTNGYRRLQIRLNGSVILAEDTVNPISGAATSQTISTHYVLNATDYVELVVFHTSSTTPLNVLSTGNSSPEFTIIKLSN